MSTDISGPLRDRVLARLGFSDAPRANLEGLRSVYAAWCLFVPFDNIAKLIALNFNARRVAGSMRDTGYVGHGSVEVHIDGTDWLVDPSMLTEASTQLAPINLVPPSQRIARD